MDTGVLISAFVFGGTPQTALRKALDSADLAVSRELLQEYRDTPFELLKEGKISREQLQVLLAGIAYFVSNAEVVVPSKRLVICRDPEDNMVLECCLAASAGYLLTGDKDLLEINRELLMEAVPRLTIIRPRTYLMG